MRHLFLGLLVVLRLVVRRLVWTLIAKLRQLLPLSLCHRLLWNRLGGHQIEDVNSQKLREFLSFDDRLTFRKVTAAVLTERVELGGEKDEDGHAERNEISREQVILPCFCREAMGEIYEFLTAQPRVVKYTLFNKLFSANHRTYPWSRNTKRGKRSVQER
jgi:hypothetical protein